MKLHSRLLAFLIVLLFCGILSGQDSGSLNTQFLNQFKLKSPFNLEVYDTPDDNGGSLTINWEISPDDNVLGKRGLVEKYVISRRVKGEKYFKYLSTVSYHSNRVFDTSVNDKDYYEYKVAAYPFKYVFQPVPWETIMSAEQVDRLKLVSPWLGISPTGVIFSMVSCNHKYYVMLDGFRSDLALKSIWENFSPNSKIEGVTGLAPVWVGNQMLNPCGGIIGFYLKASYKTDPFELYSIGKFVNEGLMASTEMCEPVKATKQWLNMSRVNALVAMVVLCFFILYYIAQAKGGKKLFIRKIAGLDAVEEAVGRATEMGKEIFFVPGTQDMENIQTIAGVTILGRVARLTAELETKLEVPVSRSLVMVTAREIVKEAYMNAGRPEAFKEDMVHYLTDDQFGYAAAIDGKMVRQKPATIFYMGAFYAESLILAETGNSIGAIQIAGTAMPAQLPFFVAACDYTLIGEELFAASAYLSREPKLLGSLKGQDIGKALILIALAVGVIVHTFGWFDFASLFGV